MMSSRCSFCFELSRVKAFLAVCYNAAVRVFNAMMDSMRPFRPNILFIVLDTTRRDRLSAYGHSRKTTPALDSFAAEATIFKRAVAPAQWTVPAHASMFTGKYPSAHGVTQSNSRLSDEAPVLAELLRAAGYHTVAFCNNPLVGVLDNGLQRGFERFFNYASAVPARPNDHKKPWLRREFARRFRPFARRMGNRFAHSDTMFRIALHPLFVPIWSRYINFKGHTANSIGDLIDYWDAHHAGGADRPLFAFLNLMEAHLPYWPPQDVVDRIAPELRGDKRAYGFIRRFNADGAAWASPPEPPLEDWQQRALLDFYDAEIAYQDVQLARLFDALAKSGQLERTTVIVVADHGEGHGEHHLFGHGFNVHQELIHVPLIIRGERFAPGASEEGNVSTRRLFHTVLDLAGVRPPLPEHDPDANIAGLSLVGGTNPSDPDGGIALSEAFPVLTFLHVLEHRNPSVIERMMLREVRRGVYAGTYKLILRGECEEALYDVAVDPAEERNLVLNQPDRVQALRKAALQALASGGVDAVEAAAGAYEKDDARVIEHLRALGYID